MKRSLQLSPRFVALFFLILSALAAAARPGTDRTGRKYLNSARIVLPNGSAVTLNAPADITVSTDPWLDIATNVSLGTATVISDGATFTISSNAPSSFPLGTTDVTWKAVDADGNAITAVQKVTVIDTEKPYIARMYEIAVVNDPGQCGAVVQLFTPDYYDNSGSVTFTNDAPAYFPVGSFLVTWTGTDKYGNSDTATQLVTVIDNELPSISTTDITVSSQAGKNGAAVNLGTPVTADNCGVVSVENDAPAFFPIGTTIVRWTVTDKVGYTNITTQKVVVTDDEKPRISTPSSITINNSPGQCGSSAALVPPSASDNSGSVVVTNNINGLLPAGTNIVTWTATDNSGNKTTVTQTVIVKDAEAPVFTNPPVNMTVSCDGIPAATTPAVTDNCTASPTVTFSQSSTQATGTNSLTRYNYIITRTWIAKDAAGNTSATKQVITVQDKTAPVISVPSNITKANDRNVCGATVTYTASVVDNCGSPVTLTYSKNPGTSFATGTTVVTVTAKDVSGNTSTKTFTVTITDTQKPTLKAPSNITVSATGNNSSVSNVNLGNPSASDNCGVKSVTNNAPSSYPVGTTTVTWTATDVNNNVTTATQTVTVTSNKKRAGNNNTATQSLGGLRETPFEEGTFEITVAPNPSTTYFTLKIQGGNGQPVDLRVIDVQGRVVDAKTKLAAGSAIQVGHSYNPGIYFAEFTQGASRKTIQLMKVR